MQLQLQSTVEAMVKELVQFGWIIFFVIVGRVASLIVVQMLWEVITVCTVKMLD